MKILGITAEYNPFHNGHLYHVTEAAREVKPDCTIAVMSGNFTQRGEAAILDKWQRGRNALELSAGKINAVFELPFAFACNRAEYFAKGGVDTL
ncbi:MAG: nucleotidyltransferase family protein, partial [Firmicutes bacterium]|nr:nucleotidyltransferase family protein [Bacillota bacterium]